MKIRDEAEKKESRIMIYGFIILLFLVFFAPSRVFCLEKMNKSQLKAEKGQAGLDIGLDTVVVYHSRDSLKFANSSDPQNNYVAFENVKGIGTFDTGAVDINGDGMAGKLTIDLATVTNNPDIEIDDIPLVFLECPDWAQNINLQIGSVNWCGKNIGSLDVKNFSLPAWHVYLGSYNGAGVDFQLGFRTKIEEVKFNYGTNGESFSVKNFQAAGTFAHDAADTVQDNPADPSTWKASGEFKIGDALNSTPKPASIDIGVRESDGQPIVQMELSASGSIRASEMKFGAQSFGPMAIDGIKVHSMKIELPGRGLGNIPKTTP